MDIIGILHNENLDHICGEILAYLDYGSLTKAKLVSDVWKQVISNVKLWKVMVERKMNQFPQWKKVFDAMKELKKNQLLDLHHANGSVHLYGYYHTMYCLVEDKINQQDVDSNWRSGGTHQCVEYESIESPSFGVHGCEFEVYSQSIIQIQRDCRIFVRNRWTLEVEKVLEVPQTQINLNGKPLRLNRLKFNSNFITASFDVHPKICVWNAESKELLRVLEPVPEQDNQLEGEYGEFFVKGHCLWNDLLLSCHARISRAGESYIVTLRRIPLNGEGEVALLYYQEVLLRPLLFLEVAMDDDYIVLFFMNWSTLEIEIRSAFSYEEVKHISIPEDGTNRFHYQDGFIVVSHPEYFSIWTTASGRCVKTISHGCYKLNSIKIISDKFIVTYDGKAKLKIWDFQAALTCPSASSSDMLIRTISSAVPPAALERSDDKRKILQARQQAKGIKPMPIAYVGSCMMADEFQIVFVSRLDDGSSYLHVETFLSDA